jgi:hypothetical protein
MKTVQSQPTARLVPVSGSADPYDRFQLEWIDPQTSQIRVSRFHTEEALQRLIARRGLVVAP